MEILEKYFVESCGKNYPSYCQGSTAPIDDNKRSARFGGKDNFPSKHFSALMLRYTWTDWKHFHKIQYDGESLKKIFFHFVPSRPNKQFKTSTSTGENDNCEKLEKKSESWWGFLYVLNASRADMLVFIQVTGSSRFTLMNAVFKPWSLN